jgi:hypothetical protein
MNYFLKAINFLYLLMESEPTLFYDFVAKVVNEIFNVVQHLLVQ